MLRTHAEQIYSYAIEQNLPRAAVLRAIEQMPECRGRLLVVAIGKAAWEMARVSAESLGERIDAGIVITKYEHCKGQIPKFSLYEAGHPVPDGATLSATREALRLTRGLSPEDVVLFLVSGGGSALFESIDFPLEDLQRVTSELLSRGADIDEINTVRKHLSGVKGGRFAAHCAPAHVYTVVLSDVLGDRLDVIASGPSAPDLSTAEDALAIAEKYRLTMSEEMRAALARETPKEIPNASYLIGGGVDGLCRAAAHAAQTLGYRVTLLDGRLTGEARVEGARLAAIARQYKNATAPLAFIAGGETVVHLRGQGLGGRNQELALAAAIGIQGLPNVAVFSVGSDGTDGPTDAAGGYADGETVKRMAACGIDAEAFLADNDSYHALRAVDGLIVTGPTGTNVNDVAVVLVCTAVP